MTVDHIIRIYLDSPLYLKFIEFQVERKLGRSYACLLIFVEGMRSLGLIDDEVYAFYRKKYDKPLETSPIVKEVPKCEFPGCERVAVGLAIGVSGVSKRVCEKHFKELEGHPKWKVLKGNV